MTIKELDDIAEGKQIITTEDVMHIGVGDYAYLREHIHKYKHPGSYFLVTVLDRIDRWGFKVSKSLYSKRQFEPVVTLDSKVYCIILALLIIVVSVIVGLCDIAWVRYLLMCTSCACGATSGYLTARGGDRLEVVYKNAVYGKVIVRQSEIYLRATHQHISYILINKVEFTKNTLYLDTTDNFFKIEFNQNDKDVATVVNYIKARCGLYEQQDSAGDKDSGEYI